MDDELADVGRSAPGDSVVFTATPYSQRGDELPGRSDRVEFDIPNSPTFQATAGEGSLIGTVTPLGSGTFTARLGRKRAESSGVPDLVVGAELAGPLRGDHGPVSNLFLRQVGTTQLRLTVGDMNTTIPVRVR